MTIKDFLSKTAFYADELSFHIRKNNKLLTKHWITIEELYNYSDKILSAEIKKFDFFASGDNSGEAYLEIDLYI